MSHYVIILEMTAMSQYVLFTVSPEKNALLAPKINFKPYSQKNAETKKQIGFFPLLPNVTNQT